MLPFPMQLITWKAVNHIDALQPLRCLFSPQKCLTVIQIGMVAVFLIFLPSVFVHKGMTY